MFRNFVFQYKITEKNPMKNKELENKDSEFLPNEIEARENEEPEDGDDISTEEPSSDAVYEIHSILVDKGQETLRIDRFLAQRIANISRTRIYHAARAGLIKVNGKPVEANYKIKPLDQIKIFYTRPPVNNELIPEDIPLNIVYEDDDTLIVNKQAGLTVHPGISTPNGTLVNALAFRYNNLPNIANGEGRPGLVHRIDKFTSGLLVIAKTERAMASLQKQFFLHTIQRRYWALVWGDFKEDSGTIDVNIGRNPANPSTMIAMKDESFGKHAVTHYKVIERFHYVTLIECQLETGRTHQIRVHMKYIGHPLFNDETYGGNSVLKGTTFSKYKQFVENCFQICKRQALHARSLGFVHPATGKDVYFESELPDDMKQVIEKWRNYVHATLDRS
jgi:23S rRNA pseudouridine1911/1915/1917 synthase